MAWRAAFLLLRKQCITALFPLLAAFRRDVLGFPKRDQGAEQFTPVPVTQAGQLDQQALQDQAMVAGFAFGILALT